MVPFRKIWLAIVAFMVLGLGAMDFSLVRLAAKQKKPLACVLFIVSFLFCLMMGYLSSKDFAKASMNWIAEGVNVVGQTVLLLAAKSLFGGKKG